MARQRQRSSNAAPPVNMNENENSTQRRRRRRRRSCDDGGESRVSVSSLWFRLRRASSSSLALLAHKINSCAQSCILCGRSARLAAAVRCGRYYYSCRRRGVSACIIHTHTHMMYICRVQHPALMCCWLRQNERLYTSIVGSCVLTKCRRVVWRSVVNFMEKCECELLVASRLLSLGAVVASADVAAAQIHSNLATLLRSATHMRRRAHKRTQIAQITHTHTPHAAICRVQTTNATAFADVAQPPSSHEKSHTHIFHKPTRTHTPSITTLLSGHFSGRANVE